LDEIAEFRSQDVPNSSQVDGRERALLEQGISTDKDRDQEQNPSPTDGRERALPEQEIESHQLRVRDSSQVAGRERTLLEQDDDDPFDQGWIIEFRQSIPPMIGLIWAGSIENKRREAG
jgi:hypothetical protein